MLGIERGGDRVEVKKAYKKLSHVTSGSQPCQWGRSGLQAPVRELFHNTTDDAVRCEHFDATAARAADGGAHAGSSVNAADAANVRRLLRRRGRTRARRWLYRPLASCSSQCRAMGPSVPSRLCGEGDGRRY